MPAASLLQSIEWWGKQNKHVVASSVAAPPPASSTMSAAYAFLQQKTLRVEGLPLNRSSLGYILRLLQQLACVPETTVEHLALVRCDLGINDDNDDDDDSNANNNTLHALAHLLRHAPPLVSLDLSCNGLDNTSLACIASALPSHHLHLHEIVLEDNLLEGRQGGILVRRLLERNANLVSLNLAENPLETAGAMELATGLKEFKKLERLNLSCCRIGEKVTAESSDDDELCIFQVLVDAFVKNPLHELHWSVGEIDFVEYDNVDYRRDNNDPTRQSARQQAAAAARPLTTCERGTAAVARLLEEHDVLETFSVVQSPDFWSPTQHAAVRERLTRALCHNRTVTHLTLEGCGVHNETVASLCQALEEPNEEDDKDKKTNVLQHLTLLANDLGDKGHRLFCTSMPKWQRLRTLSSETATLMLGGNQSQAFLQALVKNTSLTHVRMMDAPLDTVTAITRIACRNNMLLKSTALLQSRQDDDDEEEEQDLKRKRLRSSSEDHPSDGIWAPVLSTLARHDMRVGATSIYQILSHKLCVPSTCSSTSTSTSSSCSQETAPNKKRRISEG